MQEQESKFLALVERLLCCVNVEWKSMSVMVGGLPFLHTPASISTTRAAASDPSVLEVYFHLLEDTMEENELFGGTSFAMCLERVHFS